MAILCTTSHYDEVRRRSGLSWLLLRSRSLNLGSGRSIAGDTPGRRRGTPFEGVAECAAHQGSSDVKLIRSEYDWFRYCLK